MKSLKTILIIMLAMFLSAGLGLAQPPKDVAAKMKQANADLNMLAQEISKMCAQPGFRGFLRSEIAKSKNRENILELDKFLDRASKQKDMPPGLAKLKDSVGKAKGRLKASGLSELEGYDLYIPVDAHRKKWKGGKDFLVAFAPVNDEKDIKQIVAYSVRDGKRVILDPNKAPETVVLVLVPEEHETHAVPLPPRGKVPPLPPVKQKPDYEGKDPPDPGKGKSPGNSRFGFSYIYLYKDQEPWTRGAAEIYIEFSQVYADYPGFAVYCHTSRRNMWKVDYAGQWYSTWIYAIFDFDSSYWNKVALHIYEDDGGSRITKVYNLWGKTCSWWIRGGDDYVASTAFYRSYVNYDIDYWHRFGNAYVIWVKRH